MKRLLYLQDYLIMAKANEVLKANGVRQQMKRVLQLIENGIDLKIKLKPFYYEAQ